MNKAKLENVILEAYYEALDEARLKTGTQEILNNFPKLRKNLQVLMTKDFENFIDSIDYIAPRPTTFRVNLYNGQDFILKWTGKSGFRAEISGKYYDLDSLPQYQQAIDKLGILFRDGNYEDRDEEENPDYEDSDFKDGGSGGGPGGGGFEGGGADFGDETGDEFADEEGADFGDETGDEFDDEEEAPE